MATANPVAGAPNRTTIPHHIPLDLDTHWFTAKPPKFPYPSLRKVGPILSANHAWEVIEAFHASDGQEWMLIGAVQWEDDPSIITKIRVQWNSANVNGTARGDVKHVRCGLRAAMSSHGEGELNSRELQLASEWYGKHVFRFCEKNLGFPVGDGECWTLALQALKDAGKKAIKEGHDPPMMSTGRVHGQCILEWSAGLGIDVADALAQANPAEGDVLELSNVHFRSERVVLEIARQKTNVRMGRHTAVVQGVVGGTKLQVIEQNTKMQNRVTRGEYELADMVAGTVKLYRPIGQSSYSPPVDLRAMCEQW